MKKLWQGGKKTFKQKTLLKAQLKEKQNYLYNAVMAVSKYMCYRRDITAGDSGELSD